jgi:hypothetical protein
MLCVLALLLLSPLGVRGVGRKVFLLGVTPTAVDGWKEDAAGEEDEEGGGAARAPGEGDGGAATATATATAGKT